MFSAVLSAFLIASYPSLREDPFDRMVGALDRIATQTSSYTFDADTLKSTTLVPSGSSTPFEPLKNDVRVNVLWFASLLLSLITASFAMLVKQWLREYLAVEVPSPQARLRVRHFREPELRKWLVFEIAAALPLLLQLSLAVFFIGMCYFTLAIHPSTGYTTLPLVIGWSLCLVAVTILPAIYPRCPYKTTLLKASLRSLHPWLMLLGRSVRSCFAWRPKKPLELPLRMPSLPTVKFVSAFRARASPLEVALCGIQTRILTAVTRFQSRLQVTLDLDMRLAHFRDHVAEDVAVVSTHTDLKIMVAVDALQVNDDLLRTAILNSLHQIQPNRGHISLLLREVFAHRGLSLDMSRPDVLVDPLKILPWPSQLSMVELIFFCLAIVNKDLATQQAVPEMSEDMEADFRQTLATALGILFARGIDTLTGQQRLTLINSLLHHTFIESVVNLVAFEGDRQSPNADKRMAVLLTGLAHLLAQKTDARGFKTWLYSIANARGWDTSKPLHSWPCIKASGPIRLATLQFLSKSIQACVAVTTNVAKRGVRNQWGVQALTAIFVQSRESATDEPVQDRTQNELLAELLAFLLVHSPDATGIFVHTIAPPFPPRPICILPGITPEPIRRGVLSMPEMGEIISRFQGILLARTSGPELRQNLKLYYTSHKLYHNDILRFCCAIFHCHNKGALARYVDWSIVRAIFLEKEKDMKRMAKYHLLSSMNEESSYLAQAALIGLPQPSSRMELLQLEEQPFTNWLKEGGWIETLLGLVEPSNWPSNWVIRRVLERNGICSKFMSGKDSSEEEKDNGIWG